MTKLWLNGGLVDSDVARISASDRGFLLADGLFETLLARAGRIVRLEAHLGRLWRGAKALGIPLPYEQDALAAAMAALIAANGLATAERVSLRLTLTRGAGPRGLLPPAEPHPTVAIAASAAPPPPDGVSLILSKRVRADSVSPLSAIKSLSRLHLVIARMEAAEQGADDALLLNEHGRLAESALANVFLAMGREIVTPPISEGVLPGVVRARVIELGSMLGYEVRERAVLRGEIEAADEIFLTNSLIGACPARSLDGRILKAGRASEEIRDVMAGESQRDVR